MSRGIILILVCLVYGCQKTKPNQLNPLKTERDTIVITKDETQSIKFTDFVLDPNAEKKINWLKYNELATIIDQLKNGDLSHFKSDKKIVETLIKEFTNTVPLNINEETIQARILIVKTMYLKLYNTVNMPTSGNERIKETIGDLLVAFSNLTYQINKKFEMESQNIQKPN